MERTLALASNDDLLVLVVSWQDTSDASSSSSYESFDGEGVTFELRRGNEIRYSCNFPAREFGMPSDSVPLDAVHSGADFRFPQVLAGLLRQALEHEAADDPVWLYVAEESGWLVAFPWERLLVPALQRAIWRLPFRSIEPKHGVNPLDFVVCGSSPARKESLPLDGVVALMAENLLRIHPGSIRVHVFADLWAYDSTCARLDPLNAGTSERGAIVYDPRKANAPKRSERRHSGESPYRSVTNPWLEWIKSSLGGTSADAIHFYCHSRTNLDKGALAFAGTPLGDSSQSWPLFVGAKQLTRFAVACGFWSVGITSPQNDYAPIAARLLANEIARQRPGYTYLHEQSQDTELKVLWKLWEFLFRQASELQSSRALTLYCAPQSLRSHGASRGAVAASTAPPPTATRSDSAPGWIVASQRYLEQQYSELTQPAAGSEESLSADDATAEGVRFAEKLVRDFVAKQNVVWKQSDETWDFFDF
ncbi:MAG: hypothetical protein WD468_05135 [Pirellulales bacterium]